MKETIFTSSTEVGTTILHGHLRHIKAWPFEGQKQYLHFSIILRP